MLFSVLVYLFTPALLRSCLEIVGCVNVIFSRHFTNFYENASYSSVRTKNVYSTRFSLFLN